MALTATEKAAMIATTHETALALVDDLQHIREIIAKPEPTPGDIRRISNQLRRILIDSGGDIRKVAPPRIGPLELLAPDILPLIRLGERKPWNFLSAGVAEVFGITVDALILQEGAHSRSVKGYRQGSTVSIRLDGFLSQKIICFEGRWVSRADVIKYVANVAHGVHSGDPKEPNHGLLKKIRYIETVKLNGGNLTLNFNPKASGSSDKPIEIDRSALDIILIQLISAA